MVLVAAHLPSYAFQQDIHFKAEAPDAMLITSGSCFNHAMLHRKPRDRKATSSSPIREEVIIETFFPCAIERRQQALTGPPWITEEGFIAMERRCADKPRRRWN